jgi:hypothetical protein
MGSRVKVGLNGNAKNTNLAAYRRKNVFQKSKFWFIALGIWVVLIGAAIYFDDGEDQNTVPVNEADSLMTTYMAQ